MTRVVFHPGDLVAFRDFPSIRGRVQAILPAEPDKGISEDISVDMFIPPDEPGFMYTGIVENFWSGSEDLTLLERKEHV